MGTTSSTTTTATTTSTTTTKTTTTATSTSTTTIAAGSRGRGRAKCVTVTGEECVFPFLYEEVYYNGCTDIHKGELWCATRTDLRDNYMSGNWGICDHDVCPADI